MENFFQFMLVLHIVGGATGLIFGTILLFQKKGNGSHVFLGKVFYYGMLLAGFSSLILACLHPNSFLFMIGIFTLYMTITGVRYNRYAKKLPIKANIPDISAIVLMALGSATLIVIGTLKLIHGDSFGFALLFFSLIGVQYIREDWKNFKHPKPNLFMLGHISRMVGSYIASLTAFLVVNYKLLPPQIPGVVLWMAPSLVLTPLIFKWTRPFNKKKMTTQS